MVKQPNQTKRPKLFSSKHVDDYIPGSITKIRLSNFMTFTSLTCNPSSRLNLLIGPNGSGKSSLVCAIALALSAHPRLLGRSAHIGSFVKHGQHSGSVSLTLQGRGGHHRRSVTITRKFDIQNKSEWLLNGKLVTEEKVQGVVRRFNIQVDNLTQFLPQDRVCEFAKLTPVQLLLETEKAVGDTSLQVNHHDLVLMSGDMKRLQRSVETSVATLDQLKAMNAELETTVDLVRQRQGLLDKVVMMKKKLWWCRYHVRKEEFVEVQKREKDAQFQLDGATEACNKIRASIKEIKAQKRQQDLNLQKTNDLVYSNKETRTNLIEKDSSLKVQIQIEYKKIDEFKCEDKSRQERIRKAKEDLAAAEVELSELPSIQIPERQVNELCTQIMELGVSAKEIKLEKTRRQRELHQHQIDLEDFQNATYEKLRALSRLEGTHRIFEAYHAVKNHQREFRREVFGPVFLEINITNPAYAHYLEGQIPNYVWKAFLTQDSSDRDSLYEHLKRFKVPIINFEQKPNYRDLFRPTHEMMAFGITARLDQDVFEAPDAVKEFLVDSFGLDSAYIGSHETDRKADQVQARLGITNLWTPENHYVWKKSRYGNYSFATASGMDDSNTLFSSLNNREIEKPRVRELEENVSSLKAIVEDLEIAFKSKKDEATVIQRELDEIHSVDQSNKRKQKKMENRVRFKRRKLETIELEDDTDSAINAIIEKVKALKVKRSECALALKKLLVEAVEDCMRLAEIRLCSYELEAKIKDMASSANEHEKSAIQVSQNLKRCKRATQTCKQQMSNAKRHAGKLTHKLKCSFQEMPTTVEDLEAAIEDAESKARFMMFLNANVLEEYESRQKRILELEGVLETDKCELNSLVVEINTLKASWLLKLRSIVERINETFSRNFKELAVAGEVCLEEHDMDFDKYGILIKVKFRQSGKLEVLSGNRQSGGERSVSTLAYLIALQDITNCPFRVIDEINQGMDTINERKMFEQLVRAASREKTAQCFLLTPKVLPDLEYGDCCTILNVMNGPWIEKASKLWSQGGNWASVERAPVQQN